MLSPTNNFINGSLGYRITNNLALIRFVTEIQKPITFSNVILSKYGNGKFAIIPTTATDGNIFNLGEFVDTVDSLICMYVLCDAPCGFNKTYEFTYNCRHFMYYKNGTTYTAIWININDFNKYIKDKPLISAGWGFLCRV